MIKYFYYLALICVALLLSHSSLMADEQSASVPSEYESLGDAIITNYNSDKFEGGDTNWYFQQANNGVIFLVNNNGLFSFDGENWRSYKKNAEKLYEIRHFQIHTDGKIYVAGKADFGYFEPIANGELQYISLLSKLKPSEQSISSVNNVFIHEDKVIFISAEQIMAYSPNQPNQPIQTWKPQLGFSRGWSSDNKIFFNDGTHLNYLSNGEIFKTPFVDSLNIKRFAFVEKVKDGFLVGTFSQGIYFWNSTDNQILSLMNEEHPDAAQGFYNSLRVSEQLIALSSINGGVIFINGQAQVVYRLNTDNGLAVNITLNTFLDNQQGLWLAQEGKIVRAQLPFELSVYSSERYNMAKVRSITELNQTLYLSAINGIKSINKKGVFSDYSQAISSTTGIVSTGEQLIVSGASQCQIVNPKNNTVRTLLKTAKCRDLLISQKYPDNLIIVTENSIAYSVRKNDIWQPPMHLTVVEHIRSNLVEDEFGQIWTADDSGELIKIWFNKGWKISRVPVDNVEVLPLVANGKLYISSDNGFYNWDHQQQKLTSKVDWFYQAFGDKADAPHLIYQTTQQFEEQPNQQLFWLASSEHEGYFEINNGQPSKWNNQIVSASGLTKLRRVFESGNIIWLGFNNGVARYVATKETHQYPVNALISEVKNRLSSESYSYDLFLSNNTIIKTHANENELRIYFGLTSYQQSQKNQYRYRLNDNQWSVWSDESHADLGRLSGGEYRVQVQAKDLTENIYSAPLKIIKVSPPWYLSIWAMVIYILLVFLFIFLITMILVNWRTKKIIQQKQALEIEVLNRTKVIQKQAEQLEQLNTAKSRFFANVSHEFRTPLTLAIGPLTTLIKGGLEEFQAKQYLKIALSNCKQMLGLVGQILDINRLESGEMPISVNQFDAVEKLQSLLKKYEVLAVTRKIKLAKCFTNDNSKIYFDQDHFEIIINNLLSNALKFSFENTQIEIGLKVQQSYIQLWVKNEGPNIPEGEIKFLFDRYFQGQNTSDLQPGTGIGLSMVKELLELHSASIKLDTSYQQGALFILTLKIGCQHYTDSQFADQVKSSQHNINTENYSEKMKLARTDDSNFSHSETKIENQNELPIILVVDDNAELRFYIESSLKPNYQVITAENGQEALRQIEKSQPDFIISDVMMPVMDGLQLTKHLKNNAEYAHIPILLLTAKSTKRDIVKGLNQGADDYLSKPFDSSELIARIEAGLAQKKNVSKSIYQLFQQDQKQKNIKLDISNSEKIDPFNKKFTDFVHQNLSSPNFSVNQIAIHLNMDRSTLFRKVKKNFDCTPNLYLKEQRLAVAKQMLTNKSGTISEVAYAVGFQSHSYFSRSFNEQFKIKPSQFVKDIGS